MLIILHGQMHNICRMHIGVLVAVLSVIKALTRAQVMDGVSHLPTAAQFINEETSSELINK